MLGGAPADHRIRDLVSMLLVFIAWCVDPTLERDALSLLDHVRRFVRRGVQVRRVRERDVVAVGERTRAEGGGGAAGGVAGVSADVRDVVLSERRLDLRRERKCGPAERVDGSLRELDRRQRLGETAFARNLTDGRRGCSVEWLGKCLLSWREAIGFARRLVLRAGRALIAFTITTPLPGRHLGNRIAIAKSLGA